jgi:hypothetical protein
MKKKTVKRGNPVAKALATGEHGARRRTSVHKSKKDYNRKKEKTRRSDEFFYFKSKHNKGHHLQLFS